ncbi:hypothetical protein N0V82_006113 [Gnomoniopsis sp. IMI 355080]|nr:hypothetical protein N0V82_006113 [Gnomoniopsis sp. IMI 355080]
MGRPSERFGFHEETYGDSRKFEADKDIMFIPNYVFEHYEKANATVLYVYEEGLPESLLFVQRVGIHANALSIETIQEGRIRNFEGNQAQPDEVGDVIWGKQLRFILQNFPSIQVILVTTTTVLDMYRSKACPLPYEMFHQIEAINPADRRRLGIMDDQQHTKVYPKTGRSSNFVIDAWDEIKTEWPFYNDNRVKYKLGPYLGIAGMVFFAKEWVDMDRDGEHGLLCSIMDNELPAGPIRTAVMMERTVRHAHGQLEESPRRKPITGSTRADTEISSPRKKRDRPKLTTTRLSAQSKIFHSWDEPLTKSGASPYSRVE